MGERATDSPDLEARIQELAKIDDPAAIPELLQLLLSSPRQVADMTAATIEKIVRRCSPTTLAQLDLEVRRRGDWRYVPIADVVGVARGLTGVLGILSFHPSGYVREDAIAALSNVTSGDALPFLLIRLNDWVLPIRQRAWAAISSRIHVSHVVAFVRCLPLVERLRAQLRADHQNLLRQVEKLLQTPRGRLALQDALSSQDSQTRRLAFKTLLEDEAVDHVAMLRQVLHSTDNLLRFRSARELRIRLDDRSVESALREMLRDRFMPVRREALHGFLERLPHLSRNELECALLDPHVSIREFARYHLRNAGTSDFSNFYRQQLGTPSTQLLGAAIAGLGETGIAPDASHLVPYLDHAHARVRLAAVKAIARLDPDGSADRLIVMLEDKCPSVAKSARDFFVRHIYNLPVNRLSMLFEYIEHARPIAVSLMAALPWWDSAPLLLRASAVDSAHQLAETNLREWMANPRRLTVKPSNDQLVVLEQAIERYGSGVDKVIARDFTSVLAMAKRNWS